MSAGLNSATKFTKWTIFRDGLAKTAKLTIFTIFSRGFRTIQPNFYPFQSGAAYFTILTEIAKFTNFVFFRQIFMRICHNVSPFVLYIITVADPGERPERPGRPGTPIFRPKGRPKFFENPLPLPPLPPSLYLKVWIRHWITHPRSNIAVMQPSISEVRRVNFDCKDGETWENMPSIFFVVIFAIFVILAVSSGAFPGLWFAC